MATLCSNDNCISHKQDRGGRKRYSPVDKQWYCEECFQVKEVQTPGKPLWDMVTTHGDGKPTHIRSAADMRSYEKKHGVSNFAFNNYQSKW
jgi:hypothetical protein